MRNVLREKTKESAFAVAPIIAVILALHFTVAPLPEWTIVVMLIGMAMLFIGMTLFSIGVETAMMPIGKHVGSALIMSHNLPLIITALFIFGFVATMAEPDLSVFADQVTSISNITLLISISIGVGFFLIVAVLRLIFHWRLGYVLSASYFLAFVIAIFASDYLAIAVDAAAVTTGPITVPFLLAIGSGFEAISNRKDATEDNFGISAICSIGPIITTLILGILYGKPEIDSSISQTVIVNHWTAAFKLFSTSLIHSFSDVIGILAPILTVFFIFQIVKLKLSRNELVKIIIGVVYLTLGMTLFLTGVNDGFLPSAVVLGNTMGQLSANWILIPISFLIGASVVLAEPTVYVLVNRVIEITNEAISRKLLLSAMASGVGIAMALSITRILYGFSIWWILLPGYAVSLILTFFAPDVFVGIGFDAGEVVTGAMSSAFVIPFAIGVCSVIPGRNVAADAFGIAGVLTMIPPIIVQLIGLVYNHQLKKAEKAEIEAIEYAVEITE